MICLAGILTSELQTKKDIFGNMRTPIVAGNWKLNKTISEAVELVTALRALVADVTDVEIVVAPTFTALSAVAQALRGSNIRLSAQNIFWEDSGAFTGEISPVMLKDVGCDYVIIGHSERRQYFGETNESVNRKVKATLTHGVKPIICVGERLEDREAGKTESVVENHVINGIDGLSAEQLLSTVIAYEPVWAIGTGKVPTTDQIGEVHDFMRARLEKRFGEGVGRSVRLLYGGSVKPSNAGEIFAVSNVDGALVGGASLKAADFVPIIEALNASAG